MRRISAVFTLCAAVLMVALFAPHRLRGSTSTAPNSTVNALGPYVSSGTAFDSTNGGQLGGLTETYLAGSADTLKIGQIVYLSASNAVSPTSTATATHEKVEGVVIGGRSTNMKGMASSADVGTTAALPNRPVLLLICGRTYVTGDTTTADTLYAGSRFKPSTMTAGRAMRATAGVTATAAANTQAATTASEATPAQASTTIATTTIAYTNADTIRSGGTAVTSTAANGAIIGHSAATITNGAITNGAITPGTITVTNGALTTGAVTIAGDGFTKLLGTIVKTANPGTSALVEICR